MSIQELKKKEKEMKRNYIMESAQKLFATKDYGEVSMNSIAKEVGVNKATLYYYFKNKEALYFAIALRGLRILKHMVITEMEKGKTGYEKFTLFGAAINNFYSKYPDCKMMLYSQQSTKFDADNINASEEYKEVMGILQELMVILCNSIQDGVNDSTIREDVDPLEAAILVSLIYESMSNMGFLYKYMLKKGGINEQKFGMDVRDLIHYMLVNKS
ncbi:TetR/AcrR family transcriptional regulator [Methanobacterium sp. MBAC-LM]|uniref:TetR/AcrR family transcriptional regulator n=1 Tax=Methanobacterium sp. MBAC-LM TaxID=3412034 RepID=UPI003C767F7D